MQIQAFGMLALLRSSFLLRSILLSASVIIAEGRMIFWEIIYFSFCFYLAFKIMLSLCFSRFSYYYILE